MLVDYLEESAEYINEKMQQYQKLGKEYHKVYQKDIREEMNRLRIKIKRRRAKAREEIMERMEEFRCIKKYYPELFVTYLEDDALGPVMKKVGWLAEIKPMKPEEAAAKLNEIRMERAELRDAKIFLKKWVGKVNAKSFGATYPALKEHLKGDMDKDRVLEKIEKLQKKLRTEGWRIIASSQPLVRAMLEKLVARLQLERLELGQREAEYQDEKEKGSVREYGALLKLKQAKKKVRKTEKHIRHLLLSNPELLRILKKSNIKMYKAGGGLVEFASKIKAHRVDEKTWLGRMGKRIE